MSRPAVVLDNGSGLTKMGFSGNMEPSFVIPTAVACASACAAPRSGTPEQYRASVASDLDFCVGEQALKAAESGKYSLAYPVQRGQVVDWDGMERLWLRCLYDYLRVDPEEHVVVLSESPMTTPDQRESAAEIMFETFNVLGLYLSPQPVLSFMAANAAAQTPMTGVVVDAGESSVSVAAVVEGIVMPGSVRSVPVGGRHLTRLVHHIMKERGEAPPDEDAEFVARKVKETFGYTCSDVVKEFGKHEREPGKYRKLWQSTGRRSGQPITCQVGPERFLAPEALFSTELMECMLAAESAPARMRDAAVLALQLGATDGARAKGAHVGRGPEHGGATPLPLLVDAAIQSAPIDTRRALYKTVVLSGGSSLFKDLGRRLQRDLKKLVDARQSTPAAPAPKEPQAEAPSASPTPAGQKQSRQFATSGAVEVSVVTHEVQEFGVWFGGSILASTPSFAQLCHTREMYAEYGPSICRTFRATSVE